MSAPTPKAKVKAKVPAPKPKAKVPAPAAKPKAKIKVKVKAVAAVVKLNSGSNNAHALLSASGSKKWLGCAAALACEVGLPNVSSPAAEEGTMIHYVGELIINAYLHDGTRIPATKYVGGFPMQKPDGKGTGPKFTEDHAKQSQAWAEYCIGLVDAGAEVYVEQRVDMTEIISPGLYPRYDKYGAPLLDADGNPVLGPRETYGTADLVAWFKLEDGSYMLVVGDLKTGRGKVPAKECKQLMLYALGLLEQYSDRRVSVVRIVINQPPCGGVSEWDVMPDALRIFGKFAAGRAEKALDAFARGKRGLKKGDFSPSADACQWCLFRDNCQPRARWAENMVNIDLADDHAEEVKTGGLGESMSSKELAEAYAKIPAMQAHIKIINDEVYRRLQAGEPVDGLMLGAGKAGARFYTDASAVEAILTKARIKEDVIYSKSIKSPAQLEKLIKSDKPKIWNKVLALTDQKAGNATVVPDDGTRAAYVKVDSSDLED